MGKKYFNLRIAPELKPRVERHAAGMEWTPNHFAEKCVELICEMIEHPEARVLPDLVAKLDTGNITPMPLPAKGSYPVGQEGLRAAEESPSKAPPRRAHGK